MPAVLCRDVHDSAGVGQILRRADTTACAGVTSFYSPWVGRKRKTPIAIEATDPLAAARTAKLRYVDVDEEPGFGRRRCGSGFAFLTTRGAFLKNKGHIERARSLAIPPAWSKVWICTTADGHIQATGRDARARKQYRYHARWREVRDEAKFDRLVSFVEALPSIRRRSRRDLKLKGLPRDKVVAAVIRFLDCAHLRIGNEEYAVRNKTFGLTTLRDRHVEVSGDSIEVEFRGKSNKRRSLSLDDPLLAKITQRCEDLPGQRLFQYIDDDGDIVPVTSDMINDYLQDLTGQKITAKDFRTWAATLTCAVLLETETPKKTKTARAKQVKAAVVGASNVLGNTPTVCRKSYIDPVVINAFLEGDLAAAVARHRDKARDKRPRDLGIEEAAVLGFLREAD